MIDYPGINQLHHVVEPHERRRRDLDSLRDVPPRDLRLAARSFRAHLGRERDADAGLAIAVAQAPDLELADRDEAIHAHAAPQEVGLVGGDIFHGRLSLDQLYSARPVLGHADYRSPIPGLYMCGASTHPGGGVTGAPGHNAAKVILGDHRALFGGRG